MLNVQFSTFNAVDPRYPCFRSPPRVSHCFETVVTGVGRGSTTQSALLTQCDGATLACMSLLSRGTSGPHSGFSGKYSQESPEPENPIQNSDFTQQMGVPIQLSILRRGWSLVTITLSYTSTVVGMPDYP